MPTGTVTLHRVLSAPPERIYRAFLDGDALAKWLPPHGFTCKVHQLEVKVGGSYVRMTALMNSLLDVAGDDEDHPPVQPA